MCFSSPSMPKVEKNPMPVPTERDATIDGTKERQRAAGAATASDTVATSPLGDASPAPVVKAKLGQ
jgi:hypothetical protein